MGQAHTCRKLTSLQAGQLYYFCFLALNLRQGIPDALYTATDGISLDLKSIVLHPRGNLSSHVIKKWAQSKQLIVSFFIVLDMPGFHEFGVPCYGVILHIKPWKCHAYHPAFDMFSVSVWSRGRKTCYVSIKRSILNVSKNYCNALI